jgi:hypothetical protein
VIKYWANGVNNYGLLTSMAKLYYAYTHPVGDDVILSMGEFDRWDLEVFVAAAELNDA